MHIRRLGSTIEVTAPAKLNLFLEVLGRRADDYHEIETLLTAVSLYDTLRFTADSGELQLHCRWARVTPDSARGGNAREGNAEGELPSGPENLVWRAAALLRERAGVSGGAKIELIKRIPAAAGLGGASSDAAATLAAANIAWQLNWQRERLCELAAELGSDVPFFFTRGAALARGRGERLQSLRVPRLHIALVRPPVGLSTAAVYRACRPATAPVGAVRLVAALDRGDTAAAARLLANGLAPAAASLTPWIERLGSEFQRQGVLGDQMSGSGSSYFGLCRHARHARRVASRLRARNVGAAFAASSAAA
jgi:4-diphosphocytidyl-2-C-methyl-D-erythritol kinase